MWLLCLGAADNQGVTEVPGEAADGRKNEGGTLVELMICSGNGVLQCIKKSLCWRKAGNLKVDISSIGKASTGNLAHNLYGYDMFRNGSAMI